MYLRLVIKAFFGNRPVVLLFLPVIISIYYFGNFYTEYYKNDDVVALGLWGSVRIPMLISQLAAMGIILLNGILISRVFNRNEFMQKNTFLPALLYVVLMGNFHSFYFLNGISIAAFFLTLTTIQVFRLSQNEDGRKAVFNASFLLGVGATFHPILILLIPFLFWIIWVIRPFLFRESALAVAGFVVPMIYAGAYSYIMDANFTIDQFSATSQDFHWQGLAIAAFLLVLMVLVSISPTIDKLKKSSIRLKKLLRVLLLVFFMGILAGIIDLLFIQRLEGFMLIIMSTVFMLTYGFGERELRSSASFCFYLMLFFSVGKFFIPLDF